MKVEYATKQDIESWLKLASEVENLFGPMVDDPKFTEALIKNINSQNAFCVREDDGPPGSRLLGGLLFSSTKAPLYKVGWLTVSSHSRQNGVGTYLLKHALNTVQAPAEIVVITFGEDIAAGLPARKFYQKLGFIAQDSIIPNGPEGGSRQQFKLLISENF